MTHLNTRRGFTLIELLVVVLIIGLLAGVAVPQYQKAVAKAQGMEVWGVFNNYLKAQDLYFTQHGEYTNSLADLDVDFSPYSTRKKNKITFVCGRSECSVKLQNTLWFRRIHKRNAQLFATGEAESYMCSVSDGNEKYRSVCEMVGNYSSFSNGWYWYSWK